VEIVTNKAEPLPGVIASVKVSSFLREYDCVAALNAGPFEPVSGREGEARTVIGVFIRGGVLYAPAVPRYGALVFYPRRGAVLSQAELKGVPAGVESAAGGFDVILRDGTIRARSEKKARHPRSAAGFSPDGATLFLLAIDGRRLGSVGATEVETAELLLALGAEDAVNLDGGGSTAMAVRSGGRAVLVNRPAHRLFWPAERAVAVCIGVRVSGSR
jgi:exopolysaccharide biosynthesis protein